MAYILSKAADTSIELIIRYTTRNHGINQAEIYSNSLHECLETLEQNPNMGRVFYEYHRHEHKKHVIFYQIRGNDIFIVDILHKNEEKRLLGLSEKKEK